MLRNRRETGREKRHGRGKKGEVDAQCTQVLGGRTALEVPAAGLHVQ
jgi:hypothetical protein